MFFCLNNVEPSQTVKKTSALSSLLYIRCIASSCKNSRVIYHLPFNKAPMDRQAAIDENDEIPFMLGSLPVDLWH